MYEKIIRTKGMPYTFIGTYVWRFRDLLRMYDLVWCKVISAYDIRRIIYTINIYVLDDIYIIKHILRVQLWNNTMFFVRIAEHEYKTVINYFTNCSHEFLDNVQEYIIIVMTWS